MLVLLLFGDFILDKFQQIRPIPHPPIIRHLFLPRQMPLSGHNHPLQLPQRQLIQILFWLNHYIMQSRFILILPFIDIEYFDKLINRLLTTLLDAEK